MNLLFANDAQGRYPPSLYAATAKPLAPFPELKGETRADVCVVGGGYTGLSTALHLAQAGRKVVLIEAHRVGFGASGRNGGQVGTGQRQDQIYLEKKHGLDDARKLWQIAEDAKALVKSMIADHGIDAAWRDGVAEVEWRAHGAAEMRAYAEKLRRDYDYDKVESLDRAATRALIGSDAFQGGYIDWGAGHIHPLRFALGLAKAAETAGVIIHENSSAHHIQPGPNPHVRTEKGRVVATEIVLACNGYLGHLNRKAAARVMPINNFIIATEPLGSLAETVLAKDIAVADSKFVINYWRLSEDKRLIFGGGETYDYRFPKGIAALVRPHMLRIYPQLENTKIDYAWGGTLAITRSRMPYFAQPAPEVWTAAGYSGHGVALATMAGKILSHAIQGDTATFDLMAKTKHRPFPGGGALRAPLLIAAMQWYSLRDRLGL